MKKLKELRNKIKNNKLLVYTFGTIRVLLYILVISMLVVILTQRFTNNNLSVGGFRVFTVVSESMKGEYDIGDILVSRTVPAAELKVGDNVTYYGKSGDMAGLIVTHKIIEVIPGGAETHFITKGLANQVEDPEIAYSQIYGKVIYKTRFLSFLSKKMYNTYIYYGLFVIVGIVVSLEIVSGKFAEEDEEETHGEEKE